MFDYIDSKYTKSRYEDVGFKLTDSNKATIIWNKETLSHEEKIAGLERLGKKTLDMCLRKQIKERLDYEKQVLSNVQDYSDNESVVDLFDKDRFEFKFFYVPYVHHRGWPVKNVVTGEYGIVKTSKEDWDLYLERVKNSSCVDYSDIVHTVYSLSESGRWSNKYWNPMEMETEIPFASDFEDEKAWALVRALDAMSDFISGCKKETQARLVLQTTREYMEACRLN